MVRITFNASAMPGQRRSTEWEVTTDQPQPSPIRFSLTGTSAGPHIELWPNLVDFHHVQRVLALEEAIIRNTGTSDLQRLAMMLTHLDTLFSTPQGYLPLPLL